MSRHTLARAVGLFLAVALVVPVAAQAQDPVRVGGNIKEPKRLVKVDPVYPADALAANVEGSVIIEATIDREGNVRDARVLRSAPLFNDAAMAAVRQWKYSPTELNGVPVEVLMTVAVNFRLAGEVDTTQEPLLTQRLASLPTDANAMIDLAKIYRQSGRLDDAARMLQRALDQVKSESASDLIASRMGDAPVRIGGAIKEPKQVKYVPPAYPAIAKQAKVTGTVIIEAVIAKDGTVKSARVLRGNALFNDAALDALKQWVYEPTVLNGDPVEVVMTVTMQFSLAPRSASRPGTRLY